MTSETTTTVRELDPHEVDLNLPTVDPSTLPDSTEPTEDDVESMKIFIETGCVPNEYLERVAGSPHESVVLLPNVCGSASS